MVGGVLPADGCSPAGGVILTTAGSRTPPIPVAVEVNVPLTSEGAPRLPAQRGKHTTNYPTKKVVIMGSRRLIAPTSFDDSSTALLVSVRPALRPLRAVHRSTGWADIALWILGSLGKLVDFLKGLSAGFIRHLRVGIDTGLELLEQLPQSGLARCSTDPQDETSDAAATSLRDQAIAKLQNACGLRHLTSSLVAQIVAQRPYYVL